MTGEFSRRSFLKYTALTAVAVAGSSLLTGCSGYAPVQHAPGTSNTVLKVVSTLDRVEYDEVTNTTLFRLVVTNGRVNALEVTKANFAVMADGYLAYQNNKLQVTSPDALSHQVKRGETVTYHVMAKGLNALTDGPVTLTFYPDLQYSEFSANWELTADVLEPDLSDPSTT
ncbi:MAG: twin-arginine translocation signal domain-containing protein [Faecalibacterium sp.]|nr:twin-arginine translocation signal domain-containing protein [Faecalibacterium sp.]